MTPLQHNMLSALHDGEHCYFTKFEMLRDTLVEIIKKGKPCVLISGNSDYTHEKESVKWMLENSPVKAFYAQNLNYSCENIYQVPLGVTNVTDCSIGPAHGKNWSQNPKHSNKLSHICDDHSLPSRLTYANFRVSTNPTERQKCANVCKIAPFLTFETHGSDLDHYIKQCRDHKMIVCPEGNGIDTHRMWETLYLGRVPIVKKHIALSQFTDLPVVWINDWEELSNPEALIHKYDKVKNNPKDKIYAEYWLEHIKNKIGGIYEK